MQKYGSLFGGTLGAWNGSEISLDLNEGAKPYHAKPYPIPKMHEATLKMEIKQLCKIGVQEGQSLSLGSSNVCPS